MKKSVTKTKAQKKRKAYYPRWWQRHGKTHLLQERQARRAARVETNIRPLREAREKMWADLKVDTGSVGLPRKVMLTIPIHGVNRNIEFFPVGVLSAMLGRSPQTIRMWERKGYFPPTLYKDENGRRLYSRPMIEAVCDEYDVRGGLMRVGDGFTQQVKERWVKLGYMEA